MAQIVASIFSIPPCPTDLQGGIFLAGFSYSHNIPNYYVVGVPCLQFPFCSLFYLQPLSTRREAAGSDLQSGSIVHEDTRTGAVLNTWLLSLGVFM